MPRERLKRNRGFPTGWRWRGNSIYYMVPKHARSHWDNKTEFKLGTTVSEAYRTWAARLDVIDSGEIRTMPKLIATFKAHRLPEVTAKTQASYLLALNRIEEVFKDYAPSEIDQADAQAFYDTLVKQRSISVAKSNTAVLRALMSFAARQRNVPEVKSNPLLGMRFKGAPPSKRYVSDEELDAVLSMQAGQHRPTMLAQLYIRLKLLTALRRGDILRLRLRDIQNDGIHVTPHKTKNSSGAAVIFEWDDDGKLANLVGELKVMPPARNKPDDYLIVTREGKPYINDDGYASAFSSLWRRLMATALDTTSLQERFTEKDLRAKAASDAPSLQQAAKLLLHTTTTVTDKHYRRKTPRIKVGN